MWLGWKHIKHFHKKKEEGMKKILLYGILAVYLTVTSIYSIGKRDAEKEFMKIQHIQQLELQKNDSINQLKQKKYEHKR
jgi:hypothetical protein